MRFSTLLIPRLIALSTSVSPISVLDAPLSYPGIVMETLLSPILSIRDVNFNFDDVAA
ncbi:hypothetical protein Vi05172_g2339 [Venturia inaequalis]|nr:hypothetical protein Vi05172_g2339 [Venturia inaequalis]